MAASHFANRNGRALAGAALCLAAAACLAAGDRPQESRERREQTLQLLEELIQQGTLNPVDSMEDPFSEIQPDMGSTPEEVEAAERAAHSEPGPAIPPPFNPWSEFGPRILWNADRGLVTKPFTLPPSNSEGVETLIKTYGGFTLYDPATGPQTATTVRFDLKLGFDHEWLATNLRGTPADKGESVPLLDWLIVTASPENLREVEYFIDTFVASPPQIEIEAKIVEWVIRDSFDMGARFSADLPDKLFFEDIAFAFPNVEGSQEFFTSLGAVKNGVVYEGLIELLATFENVSIVSRPKVAVREGTKAMIQATDRIPYVEVTGVNSTGGLSTRLAFQEVGVRMFVTPRLAGTNQIALEIDVEASQQTGSIVTATTSTGEELTVPRLVNRKAQTQVYLRPGQAVILGGLVTDRTVDVQRKVPILGDLWGIGALFRSTFKSTEKVQVLFFIRPRILQGADLSREF